jgi:serine/threonine-protein kinase
MTLTPEEWRLARDLFERALDEQPRNLQHWFEGLHVGDHAVRAEVASLLQHHTQAGEFLAQPIADRMPDLLGDTRPLAPGQRMGPYVIVREIGRGGMGRVFLAEDTRLGRRVALKAISPDLLGHPGQRERLRREARAAAALSHPNICTIYALEELDGEVYIAAEYIEGHTLGEEIARGRRPSAGEVMQVASELAAGLASAHARHVTHRDLKPENVMRGADGRVKILDFGLAVSEGPGSGQDARLTEPGALAGTPAYMAPEQLNGGTPDARTDVFALGVLLYEYATLVHPFDAPTPLARAARVLETDPRPIAELRSDLSAALAVVIDRCLRKRSEHRFPSATDVVHALASGDIVAAPATVSSWWRTHQVAAIALYLLACGAAWQVKEWAPPPGAAAALFVLVGVASTIGGVFRGHLMFTERINRTEFSSERRRALPVTIATDVAIALALAVDGLTVAASRPVAGVLTMALAVGVALARLVVERSTTRAAFGEVS